MATVFKNKWFGGIADDVRQETVNHAATLSHFDIWMNPFRLTPNQSMAADHTPIGNNIRNFLYTSDGIIYAIGINPSATTKMRLFSAPTHTGGGLVSLASSATETIPTPANTDGRNFFIEYKDYIWGVHGSNLTKIWRYGTLSSGPTYTEVFATLANNYTRCGGAVIGGDDNLYILMSNTSTPRNDLIQITPAGTVSIAALSMPAKEIGTCLAKFKNFLAIGVQVDPTTGSTDAIGATSKIYLWDYASADVTESIICPQGAIYSMGNVEGDLIAVFRKYRLAAPLGFADNTIVAIWDGQRMKPMKTIGDLTPVLTRSQVYDGQFYFAAVDSSGVAANYFKTGIYSVGRTNGKYDWAISLDYQSNVSTDTTNPSTVNGFHIVDDFMYVSHGTDVVTKIINNGVYANPSTAETLINDSMPFSDRPKKKQLKGVQIMCASLPSGATIVVSYSVDGGAYTALSTYSTAGGMGREWVVDTNGKQFTEGYEYQFKIVSTGSAEITGLRYDYDILKTQI